MSNPFTPGNPVPPERFIGRREELSRILPRLENMLSVVVVGDARIGKTSLLKYLEQHFKSLPGNYLPIYLSMDSQGSQATFCHAILDKLPEPKPPVCNIEETVKALEQAHTNGSKVILLLDEFKDLLERPEDFDEPFKGALRGLYTHSKVALILATRQPISQIPGLNAYFANAMNTYHLGCFKAAEAEAFMRQPHSYSFTPEEVKLGLKIGKRHPLRLQSVGFNLFEAKKGQPPNLLYTQHGKLRWNAGFILGREVEKEYQNALNHSRHGVLPTQPLNPFSTLWQRFFRIMQEVNQTIYGKVLISLLTILLLTLLTLIIHKLGFISSDVMKRVLKFIMALFSGT